ncbi:MAG: hypothetical protein SFV15_02820 [Polyangiaceae bacterium]|nr:hypothetical protein [Polyangiaceae bacterium]
MAQPRGPRPGIVKTREQPIIQRRVVELWQSSDYRWRQLFEKSDVMSEGATRADADGAVYYGTTSIVLTVAPKERTKKDELLRALSHDPHVRLRAIRIACLEAQLRAAADIGRVHSEFKVRAHARGACIDVEVHAKVFADAKKLAKVRPTVAPNRTRKATATK